MKTYKASEEFVIGKNNIGWIGSNFKEHFHKLTFEESNGEGLTTHRLGKSMRDCEIISELKPESISLGDVLAFLKKADHSEWYIFYVNDEQGVLWAVHANWNADNDGWNVEAFSVTLPLEWYADFQVVSRRFSDSKDLNLSPSDTLTLEKRIEAIEAWVERVSKATGV